MVRTLVTATLLAGCGKSVEPPVQVCTVSGVSVQPSQVTIAVGQSTTLSASVSSANCATPPTVIWFSSSQAVTIQPNGTQAQITAIAAASAVMVTAAAGGQNGSAQVTVSAPPGPRIVATPQALTFAASQNGSNPAGQTVTIGNGGGGVLSNLSLGAVQYGPGATAWLQSPLLSGPTASPTATILIQPLTFNLTPGTYVATLPVLSSVAGNSPLDVSISFTVSPPPPRILLTPSALTFSGQQGGGSPASQLVAVTNDGGGTLSGVVVGAITYGLGEPTGWLTTATLNISTAPATLTVRPTIGALLAGSYHAKVPITSGVAGNSPQDVTVTLTVAPPTAASFIVFERYSGTLEFFPASGEVWRMDPNGGNQIQLTNNATFDGEPDLSPDRQSIVFSSNRNNGGPHLFRMQADGSGVTQLTISPGVFVLGQRHGRWAPSGFPWIIYQDERISGVTSHYDVRQVDALAVSDTGIPRRTGTINSEQPSWSPNGVDYVWAESNSLNSTHWIYRTVPNGLIALRSFLNATSPMWSPDGLRIVFDEFKPAAGGVPSATQIWVMNATDGGNPVQLTTTGTNFAPYWSPDGTKIVFTRYDGSQYDIWVMDANGANQVNLTNTPGSHETWASWR
jgi:Tol biopolymer transport system component